MDHLINKVTDKLISKLPEDRQYYHPDNLAQWGFPNFMIQRIRIELEHNLSESLQLPKTDWADTSSEAIRKTWYQFVRAIHAEAHLPASYARSVIETASSDVLEILIQPRKNIPEVIFTGEDELSAEQVAERVKYVVGYSHFSHLLIRYMKKKNRDVLTKKQCHEIISKADEKLTEHYSPLNWAQMLEPLFNLLDGQVDSNMLRLFFEDKKKPHLARHLDLLDRNLSRAELIEVLSSPESLNMEGYKEEPELFEVPRRESAEKASETTESKPLEDKTEESEKMPDKNVAEDELQGTEKASEPENGKDEKLNLESDTETEYESPLYLYEEPEEEEEEYGLSEMFREDEKKNTVHQPEKPKPEQKIETTDDEINENEKDLQDEIPQEKEVPAGEEEESRSEEENEESKETPMWQRFLNPEEAEDMEESEEDFIDEPIIDLTEQDSGGKEVNRILEYLEDDRSFFVKELFQDSERAYEQAVEQLASMQDWKRASKYIQKNIFERNMVDMYSEPAVDFTDRMHSYFLKEK